MTDVPAASAPPARSEISLMPSPSMANIVVVDRTLQDGNGTGAGDMQPVSEVVDVKLEEDKPGEGKLDWLLMMTKCSVPASFVLLSGAIAIPLNQPGVLSEDGKEALEQVAGGALIVTYAFELTKGYRLKNEDDTFNKKLIAASFIGTLVSAQVQAAAQGFWPWGCKDLEVCPSRDAGDGVTFGDCIPFAIGFFVDGVVLGYDAEPIADDAIAPPGSSLGVKCKYILKRMKPAFSVLTLVVSIDNGIDGIGMYQTLDAETMPRWIYYLVFVVVIYLGGALTVFVRSIPSEVVQATWFAFGAFSILDGGMELAQEGVTTPAMAGFLIVWAILLYGDMNDAGGDGDGDDADDKKKKGCRCWFPRPGGGWQMKLVRKLRPQRSTTLPINLP